MSFGIRFKNYIPTLFSHLLCILHSFDALSLLQSSFALFTFFSMKGEMKVLVTRRQALTKWQGASSRACNTHSQHGSPVAITFSLLLFPFSLPNFRGFVRNTQRWLMVKSLVAKQSTKHQEFKCRSHFFVHSFQAFVESFTNWRIQFQTVLHWDVNFIAFTKLSQWVSLFSFRFGFLFWVLDFEVNDCCWILNID